MYSKLITRSNTKTRSRPSHTAHLISFLLVFYLPGDIKNLEKCPLETLNLENCNKLVGK